MVLKWPMVALLNIRIEIRAKLLSRLPFGKLAQYAESFSGRTIFFANDISTPQSQSHEQCEQCEAGDALFNETSIYKLLSELHALEFQQLSMSSIRR